MLNASVMPEDIAKDVRYTNNGRQGDGFPCELSLTFVDETQNPPREAVARHAWTITGTDWDPAETRGEAEQLEEEMRSRYVEYFLGRLSGGLHRSKTILVRANGRLVRRQA